MKEKLKHFGRQAMRCVECALEIIAPIAMLMFYIGMIALMVTVLFVGCTDPSSKQPERLTLAPGQSAVTLETTTVLARIPAQGNVLYEGPVVFERGAVVIKPIQEGTR